MRRGGPGVVFGLLALAIAVSGAGAAGTVTRAQAQLMPLPRAAYGSLPSSLTLDSSSGWSSNQDSADNDLYRTMTAAKLAAMGRITGFGVEFDDVASASRPGHLVDADSGVDLFRNASSAAHYLAVEESEVRHYDPAKGQPGLVVDKISLFDLPGLDNAVGARLRIRIGGLALWNTGAEFQVGSLAASVSLGRSDDRNVNADVVRLAQALDERIAGVLAGRVQDKPLATAGPKLGGLGRPPGGPDLALVAIQTSDFTRAVKPDHQGYKRNSDDVAEYVRDFGAAVFGKTLLTGVEADVELLPSVKSADDDVTILRLAFGGPHGTDAIRRAIVSELPADVGKKVKIGSVSSTRVAAGDQSFAFETHFTVGGANGVTFTMVICVVQRGPVVETLTLVGLPAVPRATTTGLARLASAHIDEALRR